MTILYFPLYALLWLLSRLPMGVLYAISDLFFLPVFYLIRYRRKLVQRQLADSFLKKTQKVSYTGKGYFVVDLDNLTKSNILQDKQKKTITIKIDHAYLEAIEINPEKIIIDEVKEGLLARGDIKLTVKDYNAIEKELRNRMEEKFNTAENGQNADKIALQMVKEVYEPVIKAIDSSYELSVEFQ